MPNTVAEDIAQIRTAIYGREVRESIAHGLEQCYSDTTSGKTTADAAAELANEKAQDANDAAAAANAAASTIDSRVSDIVLVQDTQPSSASNKIWIKPVADEYQVPTWAEYQALVARVEALEAAMQ